MWLAPLRPLSADQLGGGEHECGQSDHEREQRPQLASEGAFDRGDQLAAEPIDAVADAVEAGVDGVEAGVEGLEVVADGVEAGVDGVEAGVEGLEVVADGLEASVDG